MNIAERYQQMLALLNEQAVVSVEELSQRFGVSKMTIHRDLNRLQEEGQLRKVRGGAVLMSPAPHDGCPICHTHGASRIQMVLHLNAEHHQVACCPHCGLLALAQVGEQLVSGMTTGFLYGRMVNVRTASYLLGPAVRLCCTPTVLAFECEQDAERFQAGFGGEVMTMWDAMRTLQQEIGLADAID